MNASYTDTIWFADIATQTQYFQLKIEYSNIDFSYIRKSRAVCVPYAYDDIYECNYCMFRNDSYSMKWFYAFIVNMEYVNDGTTNIYIEIDLIQSWLFSFDIGKCFVEREHVSNDAIGRHTVPENIPFGDLVVNSVGATTMGIIPVLNYIGDAIGADAITSGIYNPMITASGESDVTNVLDELADQPEKICSLKMGFLEDGAVLSMTRSRHAFSFGDDSYTPVNNKLYTYPYCSLTVDDYGGNSDSYKLEDFGNPMAAVFQITNFHTPFPVSILTPRSYKGLTDATPYMVVKTDFPDCPYIIDNFRAWQSSVGAKQNINYDYMVDQTTVQNISSMINFLSNGIGNAATGNAAGILSGATNMIGGIVSNNNALAKENADMGVDKSYAKTHGTSVGGQFGGSLAPWMSGLRGWRWIYNTIKPEYARIVDNFLTKFGYKVMLYKKPELTSRTNFNYVKTVAANIDGEAPNYALEGISRIFDGGITLWHTTNVGAYSLANNIREGEQ